MIVFDDILPRTAEEAARDRRTRAWTGDVYKALDALQRHRPDLTCLRVDTEPTGLGVILGLDPLATELRERYDTIVGEAVVPDPQDVPAGVLERVGAVAPERALASGVWDAAARRARARRDAAARDPRRCAARSGATSGSASRGRGSWTSRPHEEPARAAPQLLRGVRSGGGAGTSPAR